MDRLLWELADEIGWHTRHKQETRTGIRLHKVMGESGGEFVCSSPDTVPLPAGGVFVLTGDPAFVSRPKLPRYTSGQGYRVHWLRADIPENVTTVWCEYRIANLCVLRSNPLFFDQGFQQSG